MVDNSSGEVAFSYSSGGFDGIGVRINNGSSNASISSSCKADDNTRRGSKDGASIDVNRKERSTVDSVEDGGYGDVDLQWINN